MLNITWGKIAWRPNTRNRNVETQYNKQMGNKRADDLRGYLDGKWQDNGGKNK